MILLGIETSCDETAAAIVQCAADSVRVRSSIVASQIAIHRRYGGVVPEVAARNHSQVIIPVIEQALHQAKVRPSQIDRIAVTVGPGLITSLQVGVETARNLAVAWNKPLVPVNHLHGHLYAGLLNGNVRQYPLLGLIVSGGHTELVVVRRGGKIERVGQTLDDAAGEAFDKTGQLLGLPYPGGPEISKHAQRGNASAIHFPRPLLKAPGFDFSFSGLKTAVRYEVETLKQVKGKKLSSTQVANLAASFQQAVVEVLVTKTVAAAKKYRVRGVVVSGGVAANTQLRKQLHDALVVALPKVSFSVPPFEYCTDNAAMIAVAGFFTRPRPWQNVIADPSLEVTD